MRFITTSILILFTITALGCGSPFTGTWTAKDVANPSQSNSDIGTLQIQIQSDGSFFTTFKSDTGQTTKGASGEWDQESDKQIRLFDRSSNNNSKMTGNLIDNKTLNVVGAGLSQNLTKK